MLYIVCFSLFLFVLTSYNFVLPRSTLYTFILSPQTFPSTSLTVPSFFHVPPVPI
ncbi:hypothetical protein B0H34DRAFT_727192 [Crassisporium funariophilum]|nr:hypothetical protein B0H34DRAFT_727192 [Crassisporium funariophilum]